MTRVYFLMKLRVLTSLLGLVLLAAPLAAQQRTVTGRVTGEQGSPLTGVAVLIKGTQLGTQTGPNGQYSIRAETGQVLQYRLIGHAMQERTLGAESVVDVTLRRVAVNLDAMVVTALGQESQQRSLAVSTQTVAGPELAQTGRDNFINALQGRVAGVEVTSSSGIPGASSSITIRGVSSISSSNQPLMIIDGLPLDNKTFNTNVMASDAPGSTSAFNNRGVDFTNRAADINPEDIENITVLKGPEAAALYGIDAANGAIVITTKRGRAGQNGFEYNNDFQFNMMRGNPETQRVYGPTTVTDELLSSFSYFGRPYAPGTTFYNNIDGFFKRSLNQRHQLTFNGGSADGRLTYRIGGANQNVQGVVPGSSLDKINVTGRTTAQVTSYLQADLSMQYAQTDNDQPFVGANSPLIGLLVWPSTDNASDYLSAAGTRRRITLQTANSEVDNPYFSISRNRNNSKNTRLITNLGLTITPFSWGSLQTNVGVDNYNNESMLVRNPESSAGFNFAGVLDAANDVTRAINAQTIFKVNTQKLTEKISVYGLVGNQINDYRSNTNSISGQRFLDPNFYSVNNTEQRFNRSILNQRRLVGLYGSATFSYDDYLFVTLNGRNDWTSTIPKERNSFFYPSVGSSFVFVDAFPALKSVFSTGKVRATYAEVGKDARPYAYLPSLEFKPTTGGGYGYGFTGPNLDLKPEFAISYEYGTDLGFFDDRLGLNFTTYRKETRDQIVNDIRGSYATGYVLFNLNGAVTRNTGIELTLTGTPIQKRDFTWDVLTNFEQARGKTIKLPNALPESYVSDTWLFGNVRNGTAPGLSTRSLTGWYYLRNEKKQLLIDPTTGLPLRANVFTDGGYDRQPDFTVGVTNTFRYKKLSLNFLVDFRKGGDVFNATEHYLTARGLSNRTLDRDQPRVIDGVLRDGRENSANPTKNTIVVVPAVQTGYYTNISEELFIEKDINWVRLRDVTLRYALGGSLFRSRDASVWVRGTDLFLFTNYSGLDPIVNGNTAAVGGSGASGIDYGNFPMPRGVAFGLKVAY